MPEAILYVVATPIGNRLDIGARAIETLRAVDLIAAEDTRHSGRLLRELGIERPLISYHDHNAEGRAARLVEHLREGRSIALISDAGTPLISDPGYRLVKACRAEGIRVVPIPGPSALIAALSVAGLPTDRFTFEGFPPRAQGRRRSWLETLADEPRTLVFYESSHRIAHFLADLAKAFGGARPGFVARELTKRFETLLDGTLETLAERVASDPDQRKGEFVVVVAGCPRDREGGSARIEARELMRVLSRELPAGKAAAIAAELLGGSRKNYYRMALEHKE